MTPLEWTQLLALSVMLAAAAVTDVRERRIPNAITVAGVVVALALGSMASGGLPAGLIAGMAVGLALGFTGFAFGVIGAGDAKLLAAVGAFVGIGGLLSVLVYTGIAGGLIGLVSAIRRGVILPVLLDLPSTFLHAVTFGRFGRGRTIHDPDARTVPYGVAIAAGAWVAWLVPLGVTGIW